MPHARNRLVLEIIKKRLKFFKIVALQGARQTGKSYLVREWLKPIFPKSKYVTFDDEAMKSVATESAKTFLIENESHFPFIIDEAQKVPPLFDALKLLVDPDSKPGRFVILGSTEFSRQAMIRESLTGRLGRVRIFPLILSEINESQKVTIKDLLKYITHGGLPGICFSRDESNRSALFQDWLDLTCYRDLQQFKKLKLNGDLALKIMNLASTLTEPTRAEITKMVRLNHKTVQTHLDALVELFALTKLGPHPTGTGKPIYLPFDSGLAHFLGANRERCLQIWLLNERLVNDVIHHTKKSTFYYYRSAGKKWIHLVEELASGQHLAWQFILHDHLKKTDSELMKSFIKKIPHAHGIICAPIGDKLRLNEIDYIPWENACSITSPSS